MFAAIVQFTVLLFVLGKLAVSQKTTVNAARLQTPVISKVTPNFGSTEGGTWVTITGANYNQQGLFTNRAVFVGGQVCKEISYYTNNNQITCVVPQCVQPECQTNDANWQGSVTVSLEVYIQGVEGIKSASSTFRYNGAYTPYVYMMSRYIRNGAYFFLQGRTSVSQLEDLSVKIGDNFASLGEPGEINSGSLSMWSSSTNIYYRPPQDVTAGFYNISLTAQDDQSNGAQGSGNARMFAKQRPYSSLDYYHRYNFDASWAGNVYSVSVQPVVNSVSPSKGSIAGGTELTIKGAGFNRIAGLNTVLVGGYTCAITSATVDTIKCITAPVDGTIREALESAVVANANEVKLNSTRDSGSPGWWMRMWPTSNYYASTMRANNAILSLGIRTDSLFSLQNYLGSDWQTDLGVSTSSNSFAAQFYTYLTAPFDGDYTFYMTSDDSAFLYAKKASESTETLLRTTTYTEPYVLYGNLAAFTSQTVSLTRGEKLRLRALLVNTGSTDHLSIGLKIQPQFVTNNSLQEVMHSDGSVQTIDVTNPSFLRHHALREVQIVTLGIDYRREVQTLVIANVDSGTYRIIVQNMVVTDALSMSASSTTIYYALLDAVSEISSDQRLFSNFGVTRTLANSGKTVFIRVEFYVDNVDPLPLLYAYTPDLNGNNVTTFTQRNQLHTPLPSGSFSLSVSLPQLPVTTLSVPFDTSADNLRYMLQGISPTVNVDVSYSGSAYSGYSWTVTFATPRGDLPIMTLNASTISGVNVRGKVVNAQNGSEDTFWFQSIPAWMTEVPVSVATQGEVRSNVEVFVRSGSDIEDADTADVSKAVFDDVYAAKDFSDYQVRYLTAGNEALSAFDYSSTKTPLITSFSKVDSLQSSVVTVNGRGFLSLLESVYLSPSVTVARQECSIISVTDSEIVCQVDDVPWGGHVPVVTLPGVGAAMVVTDDTLRFSQLIYDVSPRRGSVAGGQLLTIRGTGFHWNSSVTIGDSECEVLTRSNVEITCRTPPVPFLYTNSPSSRPSSAPSASPSARPTGEPTSRPSSQPTNPTSRPTSMPSRPTAEPTPSPTMEPTTDPTFTPTAEPTFMPTHQPTVEPSVRPTAEPTFSPSAVPSYSANPTLSPTQTPTYEPTPIPSTSPTEEPTLSPTQIPSAVPTQSPSQTPSAVPTQGPSAEPTVTPSQEPTVTPSLTPTEPPTIVPTFSPTEFTLDPEDVTFAPTFAPTDESVTNVHPNAMHDIVPGVRFDMQRRRLVSEADVDDQNSYTLLVDGMGPSDPIKYVYAEDRTPLVFSVEPQFISSAFTSNITLTGRFFADSIPLANITVRIGDEVCKSLTKLTEDGSVLRCTLPRSRTFGSLRRVDVVIDVLDHGFAGVADTPNVLPSVTRGFGISEIAPASGSLVGNNVLHIRGEGFQPGLDLSRYMVTLRQQNVSGYTTYDELLISLGFSAQTVLPAQYEIDCAVETVQDGELTCRVPIHSPVHVEGTYSVIVSINNVTAACSALNGCIYAQLNASTPEVSSSVSVLDVDEHGAYVLDVDVSNMNGLFVEAHVQDLPAVVYGVLNGTIVRFRTPPLSATTSQIRITVDGMGDARSHAYVSPPTLINNITFLAQSGSVAGGTEGILRGSGFFNNCTRNQLSLNVSVNGAIQNLDVTEFISCTPNELHFYAPSMIAILPASVRSARTASFEAVLTSVVLQSEVSGVVSFAANADTFRYSMAHSPTTYLNTTSGFAQDTLLVTVSAPFITAEVSASIGGVNAVLLRVDSVSTSGSSQSVTSVLKVPQLPASKISYDVRINVSPLGYAISNATMPVKLPPFRSRLQVNAWTSTVSSSVEGGSIVTVTGKGLSQPNTYLNLCRQNCTVIASSYDSFSCQLPARVTVDAVTTWEQQNRTQDRITTLSGTYYSSLNSPTSTFLANAHDSDYTTYFQHTSKSCYIGLRLPADTVAQPHRMLFYPRIAFASRVAGYVFEGLPVGSKSYKALGVSSGAKEGWNWIDAQNATNQWFSAFRYRTSESSASSYCMLAEVQFEGIVAYNTSSCNAVMHFTQTQNNVAVGVVSYSLSNTPTIDSISPNNGTALGGTLVTLKGSLLSPIGSEEEVSVLLSEVPCAVQTVSATEITCITGARTPDKVEISSINVTISGRGAAYVPDAVQYLYIDRWSALTTWLNQEPPVDGDVVWIPDGQVILLDEDTPLLTFLLVEGRLYFDREQPSLHLDSYYVLILGGYFEIGTHEHPYENNVVITLHGDRYKTVEIPFIGAKFIAVAQRGLPALEEVPGKHVPGRDQGQLEIHGQKRLRTWTKVNATIEIGDNYLITSEPVDFKAGEQLVIAGSEVPTGTTAEDYGFEVMTVASNLDGHNVTFTSSFVYRHRSEVHVVEGRHIDMRVEVGLLNRNIRIQGDNDTSDGQLFGVHNIAMMSGIFRVENTEVTRCGQAFRFGRYCTHSHMAGFMEGSYVKANSIHHSYQRAVTTHDTNYWEVRDNVAFHVQGHAYFVEDGGEIHNSLTGNLGVFILTSSALLKSDLEPSIFWTHGPFNIWRDNAAAHSQGNGFWFELADSEDDMCPVHMGLQEFYNNTLHSNAVFGLKIYPEWTPMTDDCDDSSSPLAVYLHKMLSYRNMDNGLFSKKHGSIHHVDATFVENNGGEVSIVKYINVDYDMNPTFKNTLFVGSLDSSATSAGHYAIFGPQTEFFYVSNSTFVNFGSSGAITSCNDCLSGEMMNQGGNTHRFDGLKFVNSAKRVFWSPTKKDIFWDLDGSLGGVADSMIVMNYGHVNFPEHCTVLNANTFENSLRCGGNGDPVRLRRMSLEYVTPSQLPYTDLNIRSTAGNGEVYFLPLDTYGWVFPVLTGPNKTYQVFWGDAGISAYTMQFTLSRPEYLTETMGNSAYYDYLTMRHIPNRWDYEPYSFSTTYNGVKKFVPNNSTRPLTKNIADGRYLNNSFDVTVSNVGTATWASPRFGVYTAAELCPPGGCPVPPPPSIGVPMLWSRAASWQSKKVPVGGQQVTIDANMWIVMDISPPQLGCITIYGKLSFLSNVTDPRTLTLKTNCMKVFGTFEIVGADNGSFVGDATVVLTGTKSNSLPVTMTSGVFLGSKVIGVSGSIRAIGQPKNITWTKIRSTIEQGASVVQVSEVVDWNVGEQVLLSPTSYFTKEGKTWYEASKSGSSEEYRTITAVSTLMASDGSAYSQLTLDKPVNHTHICQTVEGVSFCGAIGLMTRNVRFISQDSQTVGSTSYGFGGNIHVFDLANADRYGSINASFVEFRNFGKINSDHYAVTIAHRNRDHPPSAVLNCAFTSNFNFALRTTLTVGTRFENNVAGGNYGGGVYIDSLSTAFTVIHNMVVGTHQLPSVLSSSLPYVRPIAAYSIFSPSGYVTNNLAAGSEDQGFSVAMRMFVLPTRLRYLCSLTRSLAPNINVDPSDIENIRFNNNEAVGCRGGINLVTMSNSETSSADCAALNAGFAWRNGHTGVLALDVRPNIIISNTVLAENFMGINIAFFKNSDNAYAGVINSTIINTLGNAGRCSDLADSTYLRGKQCQVFTEADPLGVASTCGSVFSNIYRRVGLVVPMSTNRGRTCATEGRFTTCDPPTTPDRLCMLPWEKRYALPNGIQYMEFHMHGNTFIGFTNREYNASTSLAGQCIPSQYVDKSVAVATNPSQLDYQPTVVSSRNVWKNTDDSARFGMDLGSFATTCQYQPCDGQQKMIIHDVDGTFGTAGAAGQYLLRNPELIEAYPSCYEASDMALNLYYCSSSFQQYHGGWLDNLPQIIQPIVTSRHFPDYNRSVASYGPIDDLCAHRMYFSRFNFLFATNRVNYLLPTGTNPSSMVFRWDAPDDSKAAVIEFFVEQSLKINVFVGDTSAGPFTLVTQGSDYPTINDVAGYSQRNPQRRYLAMTVRGNRFYRLAIVPVAAVTIRMEMTLAQFFSNTFIANMATLLSISSSRIKVTSVREGSVITDFEVSPSSEAAASSSEFTGQVSELTQVTSNLSRAIVSDTISSALNVTVLQVFAVNPVVEVELNATYNYDTATTNSTFNFTEYRQSLIQATVAEIVTLYTYPTSFPTGQPSMQPTSQPSGQPTGHPTSQPVAHPTSQPTRQPSSRPSGQPSRAPSSRPSRQPSSQPTSQPTQPTSQPSSQPTRQPNSRPTGQPSRQPTSQPTRQPTRQPTSRPSRQPFSKPTGQPSRQPTSQPTRQPFSKPTGQPSRQPTSQPTRQPFGHPTSKPSHRPSSEPSSRPSAQPYSSPTSRPSKKPTPLPTAVPTSSTPTTIAPSAEPTYAPSGPSRSPTYSPTEVPTFLPTDAPSAEPTYSPSATPSALPTASPSAEPTFTLSATPSDAPTAVPSEEPSAVPSETPSEMPSQTPSETPSEIPTEIPSETPSAVPSEVPSADPSETPSEVPSATPSVTPSAIPTAVPSTAAPSTPVPSADPTYAPSGPSQSPTIAPSAVPTWVPTDAPSTEPSAAPSAAPTWAPTDVPTVGPTTAPTAVPSATPSALPTVQPSPVPSAVPSAAPSIVPSPVPTGAPSLVPSAVPSLVPSANPSAVPTASPSDVPSLSPSATPSATPSAVPSAYPTAVPIADPTVVPSAVPSPHPSTTPSVVPSHVPSAGPTTTAIPTATPTFSPTASVLKLLTFDVTQTLNVPNGISDVSSDDAKAALIAVLETNTAKSTHGVSMTVKSIVAVSSSKMLATTSVVDVVYEVKLTVYAGNSADSATIYSDFSNTLSTFVSSGFDTAIQASGVSSLSSVTSGGVTVGSYAEGSQVVFPESSDSSSSNNTTYIVIGSVLGGVVLLSVLATFVYFRYQQQKAVAKSKLKARQVTIVPLQSDLTFVDIERLNTPDGSTVQTKDGSAAVFVQGNKQAAGKKSYRDTVGLPPRGTKKGKSFFDFAGEGGGGMFLRRQTSAQAHETNQEDEDYGVEEEDVADEVLEPDQEPEQVNPLRAAHLQRINSQKRSGRMAAADKPSSSSLFFHDDNSSVDSDTPIHIRSSIKSNVSHKEHSPSTAHALNLPALLHSSVTKPSSVRPEDEELKRQFDEQLSRQLADDFAQSVSVVSTRQQPMMSEQEEEERKVEERKVEEEHKKADYSQKTKPKSVKMATDASPTQEQKKQQEKEKEKRTSKGIAAREEVFGNDDDDDDDDVDGPPLHPMLAWQVASTKNTRF